MAGEANIISKVSIARVKSIVASVMGGVPEAPIDGQQYARQNGAWAVVVGGGGGAGLTNVDFNPVLTFTANKQMFQSAVSVTFSLGSATHINGAINIVRIDQPTSVTFPAGWIKEEVSQGIELTKLNFITFQYFSNWNGTGTEAVIYSIKVFPSLIAAFEAEYQAVLDRAAALSLAIPSTAQRIKANALVAAFKTGTIFSEFDIWYLPRNDAAGNFWQLNYVNPAIRQLTEPLGALNKNANGIQGNGTTLASTGYTTNAGSKYTLNDCSIIFAIEGNQAVANYFIDDGLTLRISPRWVDDNFYAYPNSTAFNTYANPDANGFYHLLRSGTTVKLYKNGVLVDTETFASTSLSINPVELCKAFSSLRLGFFAMGSNLESKALDIYNAYQTYIAP